MILKEKLDQILIKKKKNYRLVIIQIINENY